MKKILFFLFSIFVLSLLFNSSVEAASKVKGYYKPKTGSYVQPYYRSSPNSSRFDNWSTKGNYNPYTGKKGYTDPFKLKYRR